MSDFVHIQCHSNRLSKVLGPKSWPHVYEWLDVAATVDEVSVHTGKHSPTPMLCKEARKYQGKRSEMLEMLVQNLAIFNFLWGSLESTVKRINPKGFDGRRAKEDFGMRGSTTSRGVYYLRSAYDPKPPVPKYTETLTHLEDLIEETDTLSSVLQQLEVHDYMGETGHGLYLASQIRNDFAHGSAPIPRPSSWKRKERKLSGDETLKSDLLRMGSRMALLSMQMLVLAAWDKHSYNRDIEIYPNNTEEGIEVSSRQVLRNLHLKNFPAQEANR